MLPGWKYCTKNQEERWGEIKSGCVNPSVASLDSKNRKKTLKERAEGTLVRLALHTH